MWGEAAYAATYLLNRSSTKSLNKTPYEEWYDKKPNLNNLRLFGYVAYTKILELLKKLNAHSKKLVFVGYAPNEYRLWDKEKRKIIISRDVKFDNKIELDSNKSNTTDIKIFQNDLTQDEFDNESKMIIQKSSRTTTKMQKKKMQKKKMQEKKM